ncbi:unnamed protein product [Hymenolepis diminuta]|uniref:Uncharacterized protein n=1 Tax=Hymenolepis diminuta TaxID=6216 RepID=A0A564Y858_HYMDI|nr:unnamed protein product [Hymenolepis diminuta]
MFDQNAGQSDGTDGSPNALDESSFPGDVDSLNIAPKISPETISQIDHQINVSAFVIVLCNF